VLVPVGRIGGRLDNDAADYVFAPDIYLTLALAYDSLASPTVQMDPQGVLQPTYGEMQRLLAEAQSAGLEHLESQVTGGEDDRVIERLRINALFLSDALENPSPDDRTDLPLEYRHLRRTMITAERQAVLEARAEGRYQEPADRSVLAFLDAEASALKARGADGKKPLM